MKAVEKAFYNLMFAVEYNEELKPISKITKGKVEKMYNHMFSIEIYKYLENKAKYNVETYM